MTEELDSLDIRILDLLQTDATMPVADVAERVGSSKSVVWRRIQKYLSSGLIQGRVAVLDAHQLGLTLTVFARIKMARHGRNVLPDFVEAIRRYPQVVECHTLTGDMDFLLKIVARDVEDYEHFFWHELSQIEGVQEVSSSISLSQFVQTTRLPLDNVAVVKP